jgi:sec-independent protein translocase protein TatC
MPLVEHLRELRRRVVRSALALCVATVIAFFFYGHLFDLVTHPFESIRQQYEREGATVTLNFQGIGDPFSYALKICALAGLFASSPVWMYQLWAFITPGLHKNERRWAVGFILVSVPLFLTGAVVAYLVLPKGFDLLVGFNPRPQEVANIIGFDKYLTFVTRMFIVFGVSFVLPVFLVALNLVGVVRARQLFRVWRYVVLGGFVFAAVATPSGDPWTMTVLAVPLLLLYFGAAAFCVVVERRRKTSEIDGLDYATLDDDAASPLDDRPQQVDGVDSVDGTAGTDGAGGDRHDDVT